jgi:hypothetical protein
MSAPVPLIELDARHPTLVLRPEPGAEADDREAAPVSGWHS